MREIISSSWSGRKQTALFPGGRNYLLKLFRYSYTDLHRIEAAGDPSPDTQKYPTGCLLAVLQVFYSFLLLANALSFKTQVRHPWIQGAPLASSKWVTLHSPQPHSIPSLLLSSRCSHSAENRRKALHPPDLSPVLLPDRRTPSYRFGKGVPSSGWTRSHARQQP